MEGSFPTSSYTHLTLSERSGEETKMHPLNRSFMLIMTIVIIVLLTGAESQEAAAAAIPGAAGEGTVHPATGAYGAKIQIEIPDYFGLEPELSLVYSSSLAPGFAGVGWNLSGESFI